MDWFEQLTGFRETGYEDTRRRLAVEGRELVSRVNGSRHGIGELELVALGELRGRVRALAPQRGRLRVRCVVGDVRQLHHAAELRGALFQVASQFNLLEMTGPDVTPEHGVTIYQHDRTQGPACAIAAGAATIYRNYFAPVGGADGLAAQVGQTAARQLDGLADLGVALATATGRPADELWTLRNGYAMCSASGLQAIDTHLASLDERARDALRARLRIGLHWHVEVTDAPGPQRPRVSQAFCSALPVAYGRLPQALWAGFARLVLEAAYEATLQAAVLNAVQGGSRVVLLTRLGGGAFGNHDAWIDAALRRALDAHRAHELDVRLVSYAGADPSSRAIERDYA